MKALFGIGFVVLILGLASLVVPIPQREREGISVVGVSLGVETRHVETRHEEKVHPALSAVMILGGLGAMAAGKRRNS
jgi:NAD/NADP transhydrogenase beta subunit